MCYNVEMRRVIMTINDILNMDYSFFNKMTRQELVKYTNQLVSAANKRIRRIEQQDKYYSHAYEGLKDIRNIPRFSTKGKTLNQLRNEFVEVKDFLKSRTSTLRGIRDIRAEVREQLKKLNINVSDTHYDSFFTVTDRLIERYPHLLLKLEEKYKIFETISSYLSDGFSIDDVTEKMIKEMEGDDYETEQLSAKFYKIE